MTFILLMIFSFEVKQNEVIRLQGYENNTIKKVYLIQYNDKPFSLIQKINVKGYKDDIVMYIHTDIRTEKLTDINIVFQNETDHYGGYISKNWFLNRFKDKNINLNINLVKMSAKKQNEIVAVTGATISSQAVIDGVNITFENHKKIKEKLSK